MTAASLLWYGYLAYLSKPAQHRPIYRTIRAGSAKSIVEIGVGDGLLAQRMIQVALRYAGTEKVRYAGIDLFDMRETGGLTIKGAHQLLKGEQVRTKLIPGDPYSALARNANMLTGADLIVIAADLDAESLARAWFYVPRMLHDNSVVYVERPQPEKPPYYEQLSHQAVAELAGLNQTHRRRAA